MYSINFSFADHDNCCSFKTGSHCHSYYHHSHDGRIEDRLSNRCPSIDRGSPRDQRTVLLNRPRNRELYYVAYVCGDDVRSSARRHVRKPAVCVMIDGVQPSGSAPNPAARYVSIQGMNGFLSAFHCSLLVGIWNIRRLDLGRPQCLIGPESGWI